MTSVMEARFRTIVLKRGMARTLRYSWFERRALHLYSLVTLALVYGSLALVEHSRWLSVPVFLLISVCAIRYSGYMHALNHAYRRHEAVPWLLDVMPAAWSPFIPGFKEIQRIHLMHHKLEGSRGDPDNFLIAGSGRIQTFLRCAFVFEHWYCYVTHHGWLTPRFWAGWCCRVGIFTVIASTCSWGTLLVFVLATKFGTGVSFYIVSYMAHVRRGERGNFLPFASRLAPPFALNALLGRYASEAAFLHPLHHALPWVSCGALVRTLQSCAPITEA